MNEKEWDALVDAALVSVEDRPRYRGRMKRRLARSGRLEILHEMWSSGVDGKKIMHIIRKAALGA